MRNNGIRLICIICAIGTTAMYASSLAQTPASRAVISSPAVEKAANPRIAVVNSNRILRESAPARLVQKRLEQTFSRRASGLQKMEQHLKDLSEALAKKSAKLSDVELERQQRKLAQLEIDLQRKQREFREDLNRRRNEDLAMILSLANEAIKKIAEKAHYDLIIQEAVYVNPRIDITDDVLKILETERL